MWTIKLLIALLPAVLALRGMDLGGGTPIAPAAPKGALAALQAFMSSHKESSTKAKTVENIVAQAEVKAVSTAGAQELPAALLEALANGASPESLLPSGQGDCSTSADCHGGTCAVGVCAQCPESFIGSHCEYLLPEQYRASQQFAKFFRLLRQGTCDATHPCLNNGQCNTQGICECPPAFGGDYCDGCLDDSACTPGTCTDLKCVCPTGRSGPTCQILCTVDADCGTGTCHDGKCVCANGLTGDHCDVGTCDATHPCQNGGVCTNSACVCPAGYSGHYCETVGSVCQGGCLNGGVCTAGTCVCADGFYGDRCEHVTGECASTALLSLSADNGCDLEPAFSTKISAYSCAVHTTIHSLKVSGVAADASTTEITYSPEFGALQLGANAAKVTVACKGKPDKGTVYSVSVFRGFPFAPCDGAADSCQVTAALFCMGKSNCCTTCFDGTCIAGFNGGSGGCTVPDVSLASLTTDNGCDVNIKKFEADAKLDYSCSVKPAITSILVNAVPTDASAVVEIVGQEALVLDAGNLIRIKVTNQNEYTGRISRTYTITVDKAMVACSGIPHECDQAFHSFCGDTHTGNLAADCCVACDIYKKECVPGFATVIGTCSTVMGDCATLLNMRLDNGCDIIYNPNVQDYSCTVPNAIVKVDVYTDQLFPRTIVEVVGNDGLRAGEDNLIRVIVKGVCTDTTISEKTYNINVHRLEEAPSPIESRIKSLQATLKEIAERPEEGEAPINVYVHKGEAVTLAVHKPGDEQHVKLVTIHPKPGDANVVVDEPQLAIAVDKIKRRYENPGYSYDPNDQGGLVEPAYASDLPKGGAGDDQIVIPLVTPTPSPSPTPSDSGDQPAPSPSPSDAPSSDGTITTDPAPTTDPTATTTDSGTASTTDPASTTDATNTDSTTTTTDPATATTTDATSTTTTTTDPASTTDATTTTTDPATTTPTTDPTTTTTADPTTTTTTTTDPTTTTTTDPTTTPTTDPTTTTTTDTTTTDPTTTTTTDPTTTTTADPTTTTTTDPTTTTTTDTTTSTTTDPTTPIDSNTPPSDPIAPVDPITNPDPTPTPDTTTPTTDITTPVETPSATDTTTTTPTTDPVPVPDATAPDTSTDPAPGVDTMAPPTDPAPSGSDNGTPPSDPAPVL